MSAFPAVKTRLNVGKSTDLNGRCQRKIGLTETRAAETVTSSLPSSLSYVSRVHQALLLAFDKIINHSLPVALDVC